jgi:HEAT repeat protein
MDKIKRLMRLMMESSPVGLDALEQLVKIGVPAVPVLIKALKKKGSHARWLVATVIERITSANPRDVVVVKAIPMLVRALKDENDHVRWYVARALGRIGVANEQFGINLGMLKKGKTRQERYGAISAFEEITDTRAVPALIVPALIGALKGNESEVQMGAVIALEKVGDTSAVPALIETLDDQGGHVIHALNGILGRYKTLEAVSEFEAQLLKSFQNLANMHQKNDKIAYAMFEISKLRIAAAQKKNKLAPMRDVILDGVPKPPKKPDMYQHIRRTVRNG